MGTYPTTPRNDFLEWCQVHAPIFTANAAIIGLTPAQASAFASALADAKTAEDERAIAAQTAKTATQTATMKFTDLRSQARAVVGIIKSFAIATNNPEVYNVAEIPAPATPGVMPPPGQPTDMSVTLDPTSGALQLRWKCTNPQGATGTAYIVRRRTTTGAAGGWEFVGVTGEKRFVDSTFVAGPDRVEYTVQAQRADSAGPVSNILTINFGVPAGPGMFASMTFSKMDDDGNAMGGMPMKKAA